MNNKVAKTVCSIEKIIIPLQKCDGPSSPLPKIFGLPSNQEHALLIDLIPLALSALGTYNSDALAATGGVSVGGWYIAGAAHLEAVVAGTLKQRLV